MFAPESRPLRRPKLGIPDFYPQGEKQKEVSVRFVLTHPLVVDSDLVAEGERERGRERDGVEGGRERERESKCC